MQNKGKIQIDVAKEPPVKYFNIPNHLKMIKYDS